jgi:hypothetical protein
MDALESELLIDAAKVKSPTLAAIVGFFVPALAAFYTRRIGTGIVYLIIDLLNLIFALTGIGIITALLFRLIAAHLAYAWAKADESNGVGTHHSDTETRDDSHGLDTVRVNWVNGRLTVLVSRPSSRQIRS